MSVETFDRQQFEDVLTYISNDLGVEWLCDGTRKGEYHYHMTTGCSFPDNSILIEIRSTVQESTGVSAGCGEDSIRVWFSDVDGKPLGNKAKRWITRVSGWQTRLDSTIHDMVDVASKVELCSECGELPGVFAVKKDSPNKGRWFSKCKDHKNFRWLSGDSSVCSNDAEDVPTCPKCRFAMVKRYRRSDNAAFWGCSGYPDCRGTRSMDYVPNSTARSARIEFIPSSFQNTIFEFVENGDGNAVVEAVAGSGKTTTIVMALDRVPEDKDVLFVAFNRHIARELARRAPDHVCVSTLHSVGYRIIRTVYPNVTVDNKKLDVILESIMDKYIYGAIFSTIKRLVSLAKANLCDDTDEGLDRISTYYGIELDYDRPIIFDAVRKALKRSFDVRDTVMDFDDMCWLPVILSTVADIYDIVFVDEAQDLNPCQIALVQMLVRAGGRIIAVGDRNQSLYGFRGADIEAIPNLIKALDATVLPLSITYRCPKSHVELAQQLVPELQAFDNAIDGVVRNCNVASLVREVQHGDMVICRTNAPLVGPAFQLIRSGIKAVIRGRDIGTGLQTLIRKLKPVDMNDLFAKLREYHNVEMEKFIALNRPTSAMVLADKIDTIVALADGVSTVLELTNKIGMVFSDNVEGVVFSSVHRAKGLESDRVYILSPNTMPHPMAKFDWELVQERNVQYVAYTRSRRELIFVME